MPPPDLADPAQRAAYKAELRGYARAWRLGGLALSVAALGLLAWPRMGGPWMLGPWPTQSWGWLLLAASWAVLIGVIAARTRHHKHRMRSD